MTVYDSNHNVVARNDDYFGDDSYVNLHLDKGDYYVAVTASGDSAFNPEVEDSGIGGTTSGSYDLRLGFTPDPTVALSDADDQATILDGDANGTAGGDYNFWFNTQTVAHTLFVDKQNPSIRSGDPVGYRNPYTTISAAFTKATTDAASGIGDIVRIVGNNFTNDNQGRTINAVTGSLLADGMTFTVSDGLQTLTFEFDKDLPSKVQAGNYAVPFTASDSAATVAVSIATAINGASTRT